MNNLEEKYEMSLKALGCLMSGKISTINTSGFKVTIPLENISHVCYAGSGGDTIAEIITNANNQISIPDALWLKLIY